MHRARLPALYSDFRPQKSLNPDEYQANVLAWSGALACLASQGLLSRNGLTSSYLVLESDDSLPRCLESRQFGQPLALGAVIRDAVANKALIPLQSFIHAAQSIYQQSWSDLSWNMVGWTFRQLGLAGQLGGDDTIPKGQYIIMENLEAMAQLLRHQMAQNTSLFDRVFTKTHFKQIFSPSLATHRLLSDTDWEILLIFLARDQGTIEYNGKVIRIRHVDEARGISDEDATIASMKELTRSLKHQTNLLSRRLDELDQEIKKAIALKSRVTAAAALKAKKCTEISLSRRYATLSQLEEVVAKLEQASDNVQLMRLMESSAIIMTNLNTQTGGTERVGNVMERVRGQIGEIDEIAAIMAESTAPVVDEAEVEEELDAMEKQEAKELQFKAADAQDAIQVQKQLAHLSPVPIDLVLGQEMAPTSTSEKELQASH